MAARVECLVYPQFVYLPRSGRVIQADSVARLDRAFWTTLAPPTAPEPLFLSEQRMGVLQCQLLFLQGLPHASRVPGDGRAPQPRTERRAPRAGIALASVARPPSWRA